MCLLRASLWQGRAGLVDKYTHPAMHGNEEQVLKPDCRAAALH